MGRSLRERNSKFKIENAKVGESAAFPFAFCILNFAFRRQRRRFMNSLDIRDRGPTLTSPPNQRRLACRILGAEERGNQLKRRLATVRGE
jgi:hypothetical protein